jgi:hypothetical protein
MYRKCSAIPLERAEALPLRYTDDLLGTECRAGCAISVFLLDLSENPQIVKDSGEQCDPLYARVSADRGTIANWISAFRFRVRLQHKDLRSPQKLRQKGPPEHADSSS